MPPQAKKIQLILCILSQKEIRYRIHSTLVDDDSTMQQIAADKLELSKTCLSTR
jgi:hypothetical protein